VFEHEKHKQKPDWMNNEFKTLILMLIVLVGVPAVPGGTQNAGHAPPPAPAQTFPESYLEGTADFNLALQIQGDLRGNYGPCG
jgi:hypothetical protein